MDLPVLPRLHSDHDADDYLLFEHAQPRQCKTERLTDMANHPTIAKRLPERYSNPIARDQWPLFANWLLVWVVIANAGFAIMWMIGAPPRFFEIVLTGLAGLVVRTRAIWLQLITFVALTVFSLFSFVSGLFNLNMGSLFYSLRFFTEIKPTESKEYIIAGLLVVALMAVAARFVRRPQHFSDLRVIAVAVSVVLLMAQFDKWMGYGMRGHYKREASADAPFSSATSGVGFADGAKTGRHLMIVMVESLGTPVSNPEMQRLLFRRYNTPEVERRFELSRGTTTYYNSTTAGEVRELCGRWGDYYELLDRRDGGCLPARLRERGYETSAYHSFIGSFFERDKWYPNIGFERQLFATDLLERGVRECGGVFPGACDRDVPALLADHLRQAEKPQFLYWLTVNSHLPVPPGLNLDVDNCEKVSPELASDFPMICRQFAIWDAVDIALVREIVADDFPPTDILIVGDHMPPYFDRHHRSQFSPDSVPYLYLRWKDDKAAVPATRVAGKDIAAKG